MKKVLIGMSGGVDSSVAAILLQQQGYEVIGLTFIFTDNFDVNDAIKVCEKLNIKLYIEDYRDEFKKTVIDKFIKDYNSGLTPNPCVVCNKEVKFNFLYNKMKEYNCDYIATGHYAKIVNGRLYQSDDLKKDQTYFLSQLSKKQLSKLLLPLEGITKNEVRNIAHKFNLINADRKDSTDVCFITSNFKDYMNDKVQNNIGEIIDIESNQIIGNHNGLTKYTIGQRKGLNIGGTTDRMYVVGKNTDKNILYVALSDNSEYLISTYCLVTNFNLIGEKIKNVKARFRYRQNLIDVEVEYLSDTSIIVNYPDGAKAVTPGQTCVLYYHNECIGGGIIKEVMKNSNKINYL